MSRSVFKATEVSGLTTPTYPSASARKGYVDDISGAVVTHSYEKYYPSSLGVGVSGAVLANTLHSANSSLHTFSVESYMTSTNALGNFYPSALGKGISGAVLANTLHSANSSLHTFNVDNYMTSTNIIANYAKSTNIHENFYPSSLGKGISSQVLSNALHSANSALHTFSVDSYMTSANIISQYMKSENGIGRFYPSTLGKAVSGAVLANTLHSANSSLHTFSVESYITSANSIGRFADSSSVQTKFLQSGVVYNGLSSQSISSVSIRTTNIEMDDNGYIRWLNSNNNKIFELSDALYIDSDNDLHLRPDSDIEIAYGTSAWALFDGSNECLQIGDTGTGPSDIKLWVKQGNISGQSIILDNVSCNSTINQEVCR
jgi:hypothetical protein